MGLTIRVATADDLAALQDLLQQRDETSYRIEHVRTAFVDLDPDKGCTWLAEIDGRPAGTTSVVWRELEGLGRAGYWTNLYVPPEARARMVYPLLVRKMQAAMQPSGALTCYCVVRRPRVLEGHLKLQFERVAEYRVLARPLRPARLLQRMAAEYEPTLQRRALQAVATVARGVDVLALAATRALGRAGSELERATADDLVPLMLGRPRGSIAWSPSQLATRLRPAIDGEVYRARRAARRAGIVWRLAKRGAVEAAVILDLVGGDRAAMRRLLRAACGEAARDGADVALWLDGADEHRNVMRGAGFIPTSERYSLVAWPRGSLDASALRFAFLDHDAF